MADFSDAIFRGIQGINNTIADTRAIRRRSDIDDRDFSRALGLDEEAREQRGVENALARRKLDLDERELGLTLGPHGAGKLGLTPQTGVDAEGNPVLLQLGQTGRAVQTALPEGVSLSNKPIRLDAGTHFVLLDPITRQAVGQIPKDIAGAKRAATIGEAQGEGFIELPGALQSAQQSIDLIDEIIKHPGRETGTGLSSVLDPRNYLPGTDAVDFQTRNRQLQGKAFLEAFESLKGGGHITEIEGQKATDAMARLDTAQSDSAYQQALNDLKDILMAGTRRARVRAGQDPEIAAPRDPPSNQGEMLQQANEAIEAGADRSAVIERLRNLGIEILEGQ